jgi:EAL domain-containing protein (putative c-di-GMP-specific phosphodiesterase class I)
LLGLHAVGVDLCDMNISDKQLSALLGLFVKRARKTQLKTYVHGIHTESRFSTSVCVGVDYLDGYALSSAVSHIKEVSPFSSDMLHRD